MMELSEFRPRRVAAPRGDPMMIDDIIPRRSIQDLENQDDDRYHGKSKSASTISLKRVCTPSIMQFLIKISMATLDLTYAVFVSFHNYR